MKQYKVTGMSCAACAARVEKAAAKVPGVESCSVNLLTNSMMIEGTAEDAEIRKAVEKAGYQAEAKDRDDPASGMRNYEKEPEDQETSVLRKRLAASAVLLLVLMYFSMGYPMFGFPVPPLFRNNQAALGILELLLSGLVMVVNQKFFINGFKAVIHGSPNMDTLVALGSSVSFLYSVWALFTLTGLQAEMGVEAAQQYGNDFYFETAAMIPALITIGKTLEARAKGKTTDALKSLMKLAPQKAVIVKDDVEKTVSVEQVKKGDIFVVRPGESIPVDGAVIEGYSVVNEAALTGESIPVDKQAGDKVYAATLNQSGFIRCEAERVGSDTTLSQIIQMVSDAAAAKAPAAKIADRAAGIFVPVVTGIAVFTFLFWLLRGQSIADALSFGIAVLVISCPCSLGLATPVAIMAGNGTAAKNHILFKTASSLEETGKIQIVALDKTGTITSGNPRVTDLIPAGGITAAQLLETAAALEKKSEHPLAKAILERAQEEKVSVKEVTDFRAFPGSGVSAMQGGEVLWGGNLELIRTKTKVPEEMERMADSLSEQGKTPLFFGNQEKLLGIIAAADSIREDSVKAVKELKKMGIHVVMITGDNERTAKAAAKQAEIEDVAAGVLPEGKAAVIQKWKKYGKTAMVGDGINDAPALTGADIGIAIGAGTDVAMNAADVVLMKSNLTDVPAAIRMSRAALRTIHENLFWAFFYNAIGIPVAAGVFVNLFGWRLNPMLGAAAMSLSSVCVVMNALRLNFVRPHDASKDRKIKNCISTGNLTEAENQKKKNQKKKDQKKEDQKKKHEKEKKEMTKTMKIEGMMCPHCEARVKETLEAMEGVSQAAVSFQEGTAVLTLSKEVSDEALKKAVEDQKYTVSEITAAP